MIVISGLSWPPGSAWVSSASCCAVWGNPQNSGICVSCFIENSSGALGLHDNERMQYLRPELIGFVLGSILCAALFREFRSRGGSAPLARLIAGVFLIVGSAVFIGCPIKLFLRLTAGDHHVLWPVSSAWSPESGSACRGWPAGSTWAALKTNAERPACWCRLGFVLLLVFLLARPAFILFSERGSAAQHAPLLISLIVGLALGALAQRSRFCITGSVRDGLLMGSRSPLFWGLMCFFDRGFRYQSVHGPLSLWASMVSPVPTSSISGVFWACCWSAGCRF